MRFANNYTLAGATALMYNITLSDYFTGGNSSHDDLPIKSAYSDMTDIGLRYKKDSDSAFTYVSVKNTKAGNITSTNCINNGSGEHKTASGSETIADSNMGSNYVCIRYTPYKGHIYPCKVMIMGLDVNTSYTVEGYYKIGNNDPVVFHSQTISTLTKSAGLAYPTLTWESNVPADVKADLEQKFINAVNRAVDCINMWHSDSVSFTPKVRYENSTSSANDAYSMNAGYNNPVSGLTAYTKTENSWRSTLIHEFAHNQIAVNLNIPDKLVKFMEFATDIANAEWKFMGNQSGIHNYPVISSAEYTFIEDCLVVAVCQLM